MPTFLPFLGAVKAPARSIGVCALFLGFSANCASHGSARISEGPPTGPQLLHTALPAADPATLSVADAGPSPALALADSPARPSAPRPLQLSIELPYPVDARPRAQSALQAAAEDEELARWNVGGSSDPNLPSSQASYHPGTRVVVDTRPAKRRPGARPSAAPHGLTFERVQAQARSHGYWPFRLCFEAGQREKKSAGGETRVAFTIGLRGQVRAARLLDSHLGNSATSACLVREMLKLEFTPRPPQSLAMVASIRIWPGDAELPPLPSDAAALAISPGGAFDASVMRERVAAKQAELDACFDTAQQGDPALWGRLALAVVLEVDGSVHQVSEVESHFPSLDATRCAQKLVSDVLFPSVNGKPFGFVVPLRLSPSSNLPQLSPEQPFGCSAASRTETNSSCPTHRQRPLCCWYRRPRREHRPRPHHHPRTQR